MADQASLCASGKNHYVANRLKLCLLLEWIEVNSFTYAFGLHQKAKLIGPICIECHEKLIGAVRPDVDHEKIGI
jgi:hypothetical protein